MSERNPLPGPYPHSSHDSSALKAFAHPLRMRLYDRLKDHGPATASMLARATGESTGQTSYHLRQLERHGVVTELKGHGTARERWWEAVGLTFGLDVVDEDATARTSIEVIQRQQVEERARRQLEWIDRQRDEDRGWLEASVSTELTTWLTQQEMLDLNHALATVVEEHGERARAAREQEGDEATRRVKFYALLFPLPPEEDA